MPCVMSFQRSYCGSPYFSGEQPNLSKYFLKSEEEVFGVGNASKVCSKKFDLSVKGFRMCIGASVLKEVQDIVPMVDHRVCHRLEVFIS